MEEFKQGFIDEALQLIEKLEDLIMHLENTAPGEADVQEIFRIMHTIKGSSAMFAFSNTESITHKLEDIYDLIREQKLELTPATLSLTLDTADFIKLLLTNNDSLTKESTEQFSQLTAQINHILPSDNAEAVKEEFGMFEEQGAASPKSDQTYNYYYICFKPGSDVLQRGVSPISAFEELVDYSTITSFPFIGDVPLPEEYDPASFFLSWDIFVKTDGPKDDIEDCFMFFLDEEYKIIDITPGQLESNNDFLASCINLNQKATSLDEIEERMQQAFAIQSNAEDLSAIKQPKVNDEPKAKEDKPKEIESIKVESKKLDELINLVSELVTLNSQLEIRTQNSSDEKLKKTIKSVSKLSKRFRDNALELRLIQVKVLILKLQRLIRDLSKTLNKEIEFITEGTNTELDKNIIAKLEGPLIHILRNSIDHGIESTEERLKAGKPAKGVIRFIAFYSGSNVFIQIQDDGKGIDVEKIKQKGIEKGLLDKDAKVSKQDIFNLLFAPGFSTANSITNVSGRGVGLDVVKKEIGEMRGEIDIESELGLGTSFTLKLPLTLSIIDTLMVSVGATKILIPREFIVHTNIQNNNDQQDEKIEFENKILPVISLRDDFSANETNNQKSYNIIVKQYDKLYVIRVDKIIGEHQAVVKPLGYSNNNHDYFSGASILGDGNLAFILDVNKVISMKKNKNGLGHHNLK